MQHTVFLSLLALAPVALAENTVDYDDVPGRCVATCASTVELSQRCDQQTNGDNDYRRCYCGNADAQKKINECASCVKANSRDNDNGMPILPDYLTSLLPRPSSGLFRKTKKPREDTNPNFRLQTFLI